MLKAYKYRLYPNKEQQEYFAKTFGCVRFIYNRMLSDKINYYKETKQKLNNTPAQYKKKFEWLKEVDSLALANAQMNLQTAYNNFFDGIAKHPKFKSKKKSRKSFYVRHDAVKFKDGKVKMEKIGKIQYKTNYDIPDLPKYTNPRCHFDGRYWYLSLGFEQGENQAGLNKDLSVGIDLGVHDLAIVNCLDNPIKNINKSGKVKKLKKKLKRLQKQVSRKYEANKQGLQFIKTNNIVKLEKKI